MARYLTEARALPRLNVWASRNVDAYAHPARWILNASRGRRDSATRLTEGVRVDGPEASSYRRREGPAQLESALGPALYLEVISADYRDHDVVAEMKGVLTAWVCEASPLKCQCIRMADCDVLDMGEHAPVFATLLERARRGEPYWWLSLYRCSVCRQDWLIAQEERHNDIFCMRRLNSTDGDGVLQCGAWPPHFTTLEELLRIGRDSGRRVRFVDPMDSSLQWTIQDLARARPGIRVSELASLLALDRDLTLILSRAAVASARVEIDFEGDTL